MDWIDTFWTGLESTGSGSIGGWASVVTGLEGSNDDDWTTSTSLCTVCEDWDETTAAGPDCNSCPGVTREGTEDSARELDIPTTDEVDWDTVWYSNEGPETVLGSLELGGMAELTSATENEDSIGPTGKLTLTGAPGRVGTAVLLAAELGNVSEIEVKGNIGKAVEKVGGGTTVEVKLGELLLPESKGDGTSGCFGAPVGKDALMLGYCIDCCKDGGIDRPGGGRTIDCWCNWGSPFGGP